MGGCKGKICAKPLIFHRANRDLTSGMITLRQAGRPQQEHASNRSEGAGQELPHRYISLRKRPIESSRKGIPGVSRRGDSPAPKSNILTLSGSLVAPDLSPTDRLACVIFVTG
jgi:hypothetical protein